MAFNRSWEFSELRTRLNVLHLKCMAHVSLRVSTEALKRLKKHKGPGDSYFDVILREIPEVWVLEGLKQLQMPKINPKLLDALRKGRGRRSRRFLTILA